MQLTTVPQLRSFAPHVAPADLFLVRQRTRVKKPSEQFLAVFRAMLRGLQKSDLLLLRKRLTTTKEHPETIAVIDWEIQRRTIPPAR